MPDSSGLTLLIVDDNEPVLFTKEQFYLHHGFEVKKATTAFAALELFRHDHVDLVLSDYYLPDFTGDELCRMMKRLKPAIPMVIVSGTIPEHISDCADYFTIKGGDPLQVLRVIEDLLRKSA
ncbi:MAG TPA: response regulator [Terriglobales bacterium]|nr:response regulator [Terriglobales bacterium]